MDRNFDLPSLRRVAPVVAAGAGAAVALLIAVVPGWRLEGLVASSGLADHLAAARPPLGATARSALALASGGGVALLIWAVLSLVARRFAAADDESADASVPVLRRADAHPDAPARRPLRASEDLGTIWGAPLPIEAPAPIDPTPAAVPQPLPADLDTPLAAIDPAAIPDVPREPVRAVPPLARLAPEPDDADADTFALSPIRRAATPAPRPEPAPRAPIPTSLTALLDRLEQGSARRPAPPRAESLGSLRGLATR